MKGSTYTYQLILSKTGDGKTRLVQYFIKIQHTEHWSDEDVQIDQQPNLHDHVISIFDKASNKDSGKVPYQISEKGKIIMSSFSTAQFSYCSW